MNPSRWAQDPEWWYVDWAIVDNMPVYRTASNAVWQSLSDGWVDRNGTLERVVLWVSLGWVP